MMWLPGLYHSLTRVWLQQLLFESRKMQITACRDTNPRNKQTYLVPCRKMESKQFLFHNAQILKEDPHVEIVPFLERTILSLITIFRKIQLVTVRKSHLLFESRKMQITACRDKKHRNEQTYMTPCRKIESK